MAAIPGIPAIPGLEELQFRQVMYRWLKKMEVPECVVIAATALTFGWAHLGPAVIGSTIGVTFYLLQSAYMVRIGLRLGEASRQT